MIDDIKELTTSQKERKLKTQNMFVAFGKTLPLSIVAIAGMCLYSIFMTGNFLGAFTPESGLETAGRFCMVGLLMLALFFVVYPYSDNGKFAVRNFTLITTMLIITYIASITTVRYLSVYVMPVAIASLILLELIDRKTALSSTAVLCMLLLVSYVFTNQTTNNAYALDLVITSVIANAFGGVAICFFVNKHFTRLKFLLVALAGGLVVVPIVVTCTITEGNFTLDILFNSLWAYGSQVVSVFVFMPLVAICEGIFNIADDFRLNELTNLNHPLLKRLASEAPGTFNHSLVVGNLAEACAEAIGENPHLARCAAYYHDIGKLKAPIYFSENQSTYNPHDELIPEVSVSMITSHTLFGEILANQYHLPPEIVAICREHHGTAPVGYFYRKALSLTEEGDLASANYAYSGPKPQSKISAIVMVTDTVEAACRANMPDNKDEFVAKINKLVDEKLALGQFDECPLTMQDISTIKTTIIEVLPSIHHSRVSYEKKR